MSQGEGEEIQRVVTNSGFVAIIGRPNVGKSTLLNAFIGEKLVITSSKPQTTRNRITGVVNRGSCQIVFIDTPGIHESTRLLNTAMNKEAYSALSEVDAVVLLLDGAEGIKEGDRILAQRLLSGVSPVVLAVNKTDAGTISDEETGALGEWNGVFKVSAATGDGLEQLLDHLVSLMPPGPEYYPDDQFTDRPERFIAQEFIREKVFTMTGDEVPYSTAVTVEAWEEKPEKSITVIHATIHVERQSQKAIIIGHGGAMIKRIGRAARADIERLLNGRVYLDLHVGVEHNWTKDQRQLKRFGLES